MGEGFNALINAFQQRRVVEAEQFAHQQAQNQQIFSEVMAKAQESAKQKMAENQYQYAATKTGVAEPIEKPTPHELEINDNIAKTQAEYDKTQKELAQLQVPQQQAGYSKAASKYQDAINTRQRLAAVIEQNKKLLEAYKQTPQYTDTVKQQAIQQWLKDNPVGSPKYYEAMDKYGMGEYAQKVSLKPQTGQRAAYRGVESRKQQGITQIKQEFNGLTKQIDIDLMTPPEQKAARKKYYTDIANKYSNAIENASSENEVIKLESDFLQEMRGQVPEAQTTEKPLPKPGFLASKATKEAYTKQQQQMLQKVADKMGQKYSK